MGYYIEMTKRIAELERENEGLRSERDELVERYGSLSLARIMDGDAAKEGE